MEGKLLLIDGYSILHRAFFGIKDLTNAEGIHTNAIYGFLNIMFRIIDEEKPTHLAVAFDLHGKTFRHEMFDQYKAGRKPMEDSLRQQIPIMKDVLASMNILTVAKEGYEADDILGTFSRIGEGAGLDVTVLSGDRDLLQVATNKVKVRIPKSFSTGNVIEDYYAADLEEKLGLTTKQFIQYKALMGDTSDNISGVPGVGEKTAKKLLATYGDIEGIYSHIEDISKKKIKENLKDNKELLDLCLKLVTIKLDVELDEKIEDAIIEDFYNEKSYELFKWLGLKNFLSRFDIMHTNESNQHIEEGFKVIDNHGAFKGLADSALKSKHIGVSLVALNDELGESGGQLSLFETNDNDTRILGAICLDGEKVFFLDSKNVGSKEILDLLDEALAKGVIISAHNIKDIYRIMKLRDRDSSFVKKAFFDVCIASYVLNPLKSNYALEDIAIEHLAMTIPPKQDLLKKVSELEAYDTKSDEYIKAVCYEAYIAYAAKYVLIDKLNKADSLNLYYDIEMPTSYVLYEMEEEGVIVKRDELFEFSNKLSVSIEALKEKIYEQAGQEFNINSPKQLGEILFEKMGLEGGKKTKTGYSTSADVLEKLAVDNLVVGDILEYRMLTKLKSTYADGLVEYIGEDDRIHSTFSQTITATGRISSADPNLQNIPTRMELGRQIRKVFVPRDGFVFIDADYSQIELRILASLSEDEELISCYKSDEDIHRATASKVFNVPLNEVTDTQRRNAKAVNFGIVYGISSFGLSQDLSITRKEAQQYIDEYFKTYPGIKDYLDKCKADAKELGYSVTLFGRRRPIPELKSSNFMQRSFGERVAMNAPIQGTAADIMKIAVINVHDSLLREGLKSRIVLQVHDELLIETLDSEKDKVEQLLKGQMKSAASLAVDLEVSSAIGNNWYEAK